VSFRVRIHPKEIIKDFTVQQLLCQTTKKYPQNLSFPDLRWCVCVCVFLLPSHHNSQLLLSTYTKKAGGDTHTDTAANRMVLENVPEY